LQWSYAAVNQDVTGWKGMVLYSAEIVEPPHNGTAVLRADGSIIYSPKPGFTGRDFIGVRFVPDGSCQLCYVNGGWVIFVE
jgi:hypothetical protein